MQVRLRPMWRARHFLHRKKALPARSGGSGRCARLRGGPDEQRARRLIEKRGMRERSGEHWQGESGGWRQSDEPGMQRAVWAVFKSGRGIFFLRRAACVVGLVDLRTFGRADFRPDRTQFASRCQRMGNRRSESGKQDRHGSEPSSDAPCLPKENHAPILSWALFRPVDSLRQDDPGQVEVIHIRHAGIDSVWLGQW